MVEDGVKTAEKQYQPAVVGAGAVTDPVDVGGVVSWALRVTVPREVVPEPVGVQVVAPEALEHS